MNENFETWFTECVIHAVKSPMVPDLYAWDLNNCASWLDKYNKGLSPSEAIEIRFNNEAARPTTAKN